MHYLIADDACGEVYYIEAYLSATKVNRIRFVHHLLDLLEYLPEDEHTPQYLELLELKTEDEFLMWLSSTTPVEWFERTMAEGSFGEIRYGPSGHYFASDE